MTSSLFHVLSRPASMGRAPGPSRSPSMATGTKDAIRRSAGYIIDRSTLLPILPPYLERAADVCHRPVVVSDVASTSIAMPCGRNLQGHLIVVGRVLFRSPLDGSVDVALGILTAFELLVARRRRGL
jgi:hypothetical protein